MKRTTQYAIAATLATALMGSGAYAADLGGNCCADLEERIAELEATTVRKGNRRVSLTISGFVGHQVLWWDDGTQTDMYIMDGGNIFSRFRFTGSAKISPHITAGFTYEFGANPNATSSANQLNFGDDLGPSGNVGGNTSCGVSGISSSTVGCATVRDATVWLRHAHLGMVRIGQGSTATDNLVLIDLGRMGSAGTPDHSLFMGNFILRDNVGLFGGAASVTWAGAIRGHESWDTNRRNHILYETPTLAGFTLQAAVAEDNYWDVALRYAGEFNGVRIAFGIGYQEDTKFNQTFQQFSQVGDLCSSNCDAKTSEVKGALSVLHVPTGLFLTGSAGSRQLEGTNIFGGELPASYVPASYAGPDARYWHIAGGISQNFFGIGATVLFAEYGEHRGGLAQNAFLGTNAAHHCTEFSAGGVKFTNNALVDGGSCDSTVTNWGVGINQYVDAAAMEIFATYKAYSLDSNGFIGTSINLNDARNGVHDFQVFIVGTKINF